MFFEIISWATIFQVFGYAGATFHKTKLIISSLHEQHGEHFAFTNQIGHVHNLIKSLGNNSDSLLYHKILSVSRFILFFDLIPNILARKSPKKFFAQKTKFWNIVL